MFRIPDYVADTRLDGAPAPNVRANTAIGRKVTRLGNAFGNAGDRLARADAARKTDAARKAEADRRAEAEQAFQRLPSEGEQRAAEHARKRREQTEAFDIQLQLHKRQATADKAREMALQEAGPSGAGFTQFYARNLTLADRDFFAAQPADGAANASSIHKAAAMERVAADNEHRLAEAAATEVQANRQWTRDRLEEMLGPLLARIANSPERYDEIVEQGVALATGNILPDKETEALVAAWERNAARTLAESVAEHGDPKTLRRLFGLAAAAPEAGSEFGEAGAGAQDKTSEITRPGPARPGSASLDDLVLDPAFAKGDEAALKSRFRLADADPRFADVPLAERVSLLRAANRRADDERMAAETEMEIRIRKDLAQVLETGQGAPDLAYGEIRAVLGKAKADRWRRDRRVNKPLHHTMNGLDSLPLQRIEERVRALRPEAGDPDYDLKQEIHGKARKAADEILHLRHTDPVGAVADWPIVQAALEARDRDPANISGERLAAILLHVQAEQHIPAFDRTIFRPGEASVIMAPILAAQGHARLDAVDTIAAGLIETYGSLADEVMASLVPELAGDPELLAHATGTAVALEDLLEAGPQKALTNIRHRLRKAGFDNTQTEALEAPGFAGLFERKQQIRRRQSDLIRQASETGRQQQTAFAGYSDAELDQLYTYLGRVKDEPKLELGRDYLEKGRPTPGQSAIAYLRDNPATLPWFIETFGADQVPAGFNPLPHSFDELLRRMAGDDGTGAVNPYSLFVEAQLALATNIDPDDRFGAANNEAFGHTLAGAGEAATTIAETDRLPPGHPDATFGRGRKIVFAQQVAQMIRPAEGYAEGAAGLAGGFTGSMSTPEALAGPFRLLRGAGSGASRTADAAVSGALSESLVDPAVQALRISAGLQEGYDSGQTVNALLFGAGVPVALSGLAEVYGKTRRSLQAAGGGRIGARSPERPLERSSERLPGNSPGGRTPETGAPADGTPPAASGNGVARPAQRGLAVGADAGPRLSASRRAAAAKEALHGSASRTLPPFAKPGQEGSEVFGSVDPASRKRVIQPRNTVDGMLELAEANRAPLYRQLQTLVENIPGAQAVGTRVKERTARLGEKLAGGRRPDTMTDYLGGRIVVDGPGQFDAVIEALAQDYRNVEFQDFLDAGRGSGYRAVHMQIVLDDGMTAEIQIMPRPILEVYDMEHDLYAKWRGKDDLTQQEKQQRRKELEWAQNAYARAYDTWLGRRLPSP